MICGFKRMKPNIKALGFVRHLNRNTFAPGKFANRCRLMQAYGRRNPVVPAYPRVLQIETTSRCSLRCIMCPRRFMTRPAEDMQPELFRRIIEQSAGRAELAILHLMGDPLLNPHIFEMVACCRQAGIRTVISTNGMHLSGEAINRLYEAKLDIIILSFDGGTKATFEQVRAGADFDRVTAAYRNFILRQSEYRHRVRPVIQMIRFQTTEKETGAFFKLWQGTRADIIVKPFTLWQGNLDDINALTVPDLKPLERNLCDRAWQWLTVASDGSVIPCCRDYDATVRLGNLNRQPVSEIWNGVPFTEFRRQHAAGRSRVPVCRRCDYRALFWDSRPARLAGAALDSYALISLMYDLHYLIDQ